MANLNVLIVGASIAGPMTAYWLTKAGARVTIIERFPSLRTGGQNVDIRNVGVEVMRRIPGFEQTVRQNLYHLHGLCMVNKHGQSLGVMGSTGDMDRQSLLSEFEIFRGTLSRIIVDLTKDHENVEYIFGEQVKSMEQMSEKGGVTVEFLNGTPKREFDLVVAADGATSRTRAMGLNCGVRDHMHSLDAWAAYFTIDKDFTKGQNMGFAYSSGGRMLAVGPAAQGNGNQTTALTHFEAGDPNGVTAFREASKKGDAALKAYVAKRYAGMGWHAPEIMAAMEDSKDFYASEMAQVKPPTFHKGRFVLVGDAGYSAGPNGFGTSLAMGGAYILAGEILRSNGDIEAGLVSYEKRMRDFLKEAQKIPPGVFAFMAPQTWWGEWIRNRIFTAVTWGMQFGKYFNWIAGFWSGSLGQASKDTLPHYEWTH